MVLPYIRALCTLKTPKTPAAFNLKVLKKLTCLHVLGFQLLHTSF